MKHAMTIGLIVAGTLLSFGVLNNVPALKKGRDFIFNEVA